MAGSPGESTLLRLWGGRPRVAPHPTLPPAAHPAPASAGPHGPWWPDGGVAQPCFYSHYCSCNHSCHCHHALAAEREHQGPPAHSIREPGRHQHGRHTHHTAGPAQPRLAQGDAPCPIVLLDLCLCLVCLVLLTPTPHPPGHTCITSITVNEQQHSALDNSNALLLSYII